MEEYDWNHNIKDWTKVSDKSAQLILNLSETSLKESVETAKLISQRTDKLLAIVIPLVTVTLGFLFKVGFDNFFKDFLVLTAFLAVILLSISLIFLIKNLLPYSICIPGDHPENILRTEFVDNDFDEKEQYLNLLINTILNYQDRISLNKASNQRRTRINNVAFLWLLSLPVSLLVSYPIVLALK